MINNAWSLTLVFFMVDEKVILYFVYPKTVITIQGCSLFRYDAVVIIYGNCIWMYYCLVQLFGMFFLWWSTIILYGHICMNFLKKLKLIIHHYINYITLFMNSVDFKLFKIFMIKCVYISTRVIFNDNYT